MYDVFGCWATDTWLTERLKTSWLFSPVELCQIMSGMSDSWKNPQAVMWVIALYLSFGAVSIFIQEHASMFFFILHSFFFHLCKNEVRVRWSLVVVKIHRLPTNEFKGWLYPDIQFTGALAFILTLLLLSMNYQRDLISFIIHSTFSKSAELKFSKDVRLVARACICSLQQKSHLGGSWKCCCWTWRNAKHLLSPSLAHRPSMNHTRSNSQSGSSCPNLLHFYIFRRFAFHWVKSLPTNQIRSAGGGARRGRVGLY